jgi:hypothetical protein
MRRVELALCAVPISLLLSCSEQGTPAPDEPAVVHFVAMTYNLTTADVSDENYADRIRHRAYEAHLGERIRSEGADVIALQGVLSPARCATFVETNEEYGCFGVVEERPEEAPVRRLLGPDYSIACDAAEGAACIAVHVDFGEIVGIPRGTLGETLTDPPSGEMCEIDECEPQANNCAAGSAIVGAAVRRDTDRPEELTHDGPREFFVINLAATPVGEPCRDDQIEQAFFRAQDRFGPTLILGSFGIDLASEQAGSQMFSQNVGPDQRFQSHHPVLGGEPDDASQEGTDPNLVGPGQRLAPTSQGEALDTVVSDFAENQCRVSEGLGQGFDFLARRLMDESRRVPAHEALICPLRFPGYLDP